jgi:hypothetical protein
VKVEDGAGRRLGRTFRVKLWPTLILLHGGLELGRVVRPTSSAELAPLLLRLMRRIALVLPPAASPLLPGVGTLRSALTFGPPPPRRRCGSARPPLARGWG